MTRITRETISVGMLSLIGGRSGITTDETLLCDGRDTGYMVRTTVIGGEERRQVYDKNGHKVSGDTYAEQLSNGPFLALDDE